MIVSPKEWEEYRRKRDTPGTKEHYIHTIHKFKSQDTHTENECIELDQAFKALNIDVVHIGGDPILMNMPPMLFSQPECPYPNQELIDKLNTKAETEGLNYREGLDLMYELDKVDFLIKYGDMMFKMGEKHAINKLSIHDSVLNFFRNLKKLFLEIKRLIIEE